MNRAKIIEKINKLQNLADGNTSPHESAAALAKAQELHLLASQKKEDRSARQTKSPRGIFEKMPGSGVWWIRYVDASGKYRREKIGTFNAAEKLYYKRKQQALEGLKLPETLRSRSVLFSQIADDAIVYIQKEYSRPATDVERMNVLKEHFSGAADAITPRHAKSVLDALAREKQWSASTRNHHHNLLSLCYRLAIESDKVKENPARGFRREKADNGRVRFLTPAEEKSLREAMRANPSWADHEADLTLALSTGLRMTNMYRDLIRENINLQNRTAIIERTKNGDAVTCPLNDDAMRALAIFRMRGDGTGRVVRNSKGATLNYTAFWFVPALRAAKIKNFHWHDLRHTYASRLRQAGTPLENIAELLGHRGLAMAKRYAHLSISNLHEAVAKISTPAAPTDTPVAPAAIPERRANTYVN